MKIAEQTPTKLTLREQPIWLGGGIALIMGILFALVLIGLPFMEVSTLTCHQAKPGQVSCELAEYKLWGQQVRRVSINQLKAARIELYNKRIGDYRFALLTDKEKIFLADYRYFYPDNTSKTYLRGEAIAARIDDYLSHPKETPLRIRPGYLRTILDIVANIGAVIACFSAVFLFTRRSVITLDQSLDRITFKRQSLLGTKVSEYPFQDIAIVDVKSGSDGTSGIVMKLKSGESVLLSNGYSNFGGQAKRAAAAAMCKFLKACKKANKDSVSAGS